MTEPDPNERRDDRAVYVISVAAELAGVHPQTLRIYERKGLVRPKRTSGNTRRYSERDIDLLRQIREAAEAAGGARDGQIVPLRSVFLPPWVGGSGR
jgi:MerR family transcriptional regulator, heat shock protein HspR